MNDHFKCFPENKIAEASQQFIPFFKACKLIGDFVERNNNFENHAAKNNAYKMLLLFGYGDKNNPLKNAEKYFKHHMPANSIEPVYDALLFAIPKFSSNHIKEWGTFIQKYGKPGIKIFQQAEVIENILGHAPITMQDAHDELVDFTYKNKDKYPELAKLCLKYHVSEEEFNQCLEIESRRKTSDNLPNVFIQDEKWPGYYLVKLPIDDPHTYLLGYLTHCCLHIGESSEQCVIDSLTLPDNGVYVLLKKINRSKSTEPIINGKIDYQNFDIVGSYYAWLSKMGNLTIDSIENIRPDTDDPVIIDLMLKFSKEISKNSDIVRVMNPPTHISLPTF